ncbi:hypothetical protein PoB_004220300 [Plakobranchus ocellatus]|uniref:DUF4476 domain-containing protein n=1 Tax=Plakobranchus ocellatus TaxID=259542 RepID=A0AAV4B7W3_9GAST|nr:hypothetical protein PoB_004220300 [Plakobranchus ocellatus]
MKTASFLLALYLGLAAANSVKRQASDAPPTMPTMPDDMGMTVYDPAKLSLETRGLQTDAPEMTTPMETAPPTQPPAPTKLTEIDEIIIDFDTLSGSDFYKRLSYEDQLLALEVLTGSEVGKMTAILNEIGYKHFIRFLYDLPLKYIDSFKDVIDRGFEKEMKLLNSQ